MIYDYQTGGSAITSYNLERYNSGTWDEVVGQTTDYLLLSKSIDSVSVGTSYTFRIRAKNLFGYGPYSDTATLSPVDVPDKMATL